MKYLEKIWRNGVLVRQRLEAKADRQMFVTTCNVYSRMDNIVEYWFDQYNDNECGFTCRYTDGDCLYKVDVELFNEDTKFVLEELK